MHEWGVVLYVMLYGVGKQQKQQQQQQLDELTNNF